MTLFFFLFIAFSENKIFLEETFDNSDWEERWIFSQLRPTRSDHKLGKFRLTSGSFYGNQTKQRGIQTIDEHAWYRITSKLNEPFNKTKDKDLIIQYTLRLEEGFESTGGYIKLHSGDIKPLKYGPSSRYELIFGPEFVLPDTHKLLFIIHRNGSDFDMRKYIDVPYDELTHSYTLAIFENRTYQVKIDGDEVDRGFLIEEFEVGGSEFILDPDDFMPDYWDDREEIDDPEDVKPIDWDDRAEILDTETPINLGEKKPKLIPNPDYKGQWYPRKIPNPNYMGEWTPRQIRNPSYFEDNDFGNFEDIQYLGIDVFQKTSGTIFDNFLITNDYEYAEKALNENFLMLRYDELEMYNKVQIDKAVEAELLKIEGQSDDSSNELFSSESSSDDKDESNEEENEANFILNEKDVSDGPKASDFQFPLNIENNLYFLKRDNKNTRLSSEEGREKYRKIREERFNKREISEDEEL